MSLMEEATGSVPVTITYRVENLDEGSTIEVDFASNLSHCAVAETVVDQHWEMWGNPEEVDLIVTALSGLHKDKPVPVRVIARVETVFEGTADYEAFN